MLDRRRVLAASVALAAPRAAAAAAPPSPPVPTVEALIRKAETAGGFVAVARSGRLASFRPWGLASHAFPAPVTPTTLFHLGSCGKQFTGLAVQQLVEAGRVRPGAAVSTYVRDLPQGWAGVTVAQLLHQTSGLPDYLDGDTLWDRPMDRAAFLKVLAPKPALFAPGRSWAYSNTNYLVLGWLIEDVSGLSYADYLARCVFGPAGRFAPARTRRRR